MLQVPSVTMNGGSRRWVTSTPLTSRRRCADEEADGKASGAGTPAPTASLPMTTERQHHDRADREVDAGGQDDQRLGDAENADDRDLLQDQREVEGIEEALADDGAEEQHAQQQHDERG